MYSRWSVNGKKMGTCTASYDTFYYDLAFVTRDNSLFDKWIPKSVVNYSGQIIHGTDAREPYLFLIQGIGCTLDAGGIAKGTITKVSANLSPTALGRVTASYYSSAADSGGPVWVGRQLDGFYQRAVVAIHNGSYLNANGTRAGAYGTNVKYVYQLFGTSSIYSE